MEVEDEEAQICRLCGQCESIYIDVFGEEGTKRYLGLKIHAKINILIKEDDGLPSMVCMRCLGTLEFLCDFHEQCHRTQRRFLSTDFLKPSTQNQSEAESDKENVSPLKNFKRKIKTTQPPAEKFVKICKAAGDSLSESVNFNTTCGTEDIQVDAKQAELTSMIKFESDVNICSERNNDSRIKNQENSKSSDVLLLIDHKCKKKDDSPCQTLNVAGEKNREEKTAKVGVSTTRYKRKGRPKNNFVSRRTRRFDGLSTTKDKNVCFNISDIGTSMVKSSIMKKTCVVRLESCLHKVKNQCQKCEDAVDGDDQVYSLSSCLESPLDMNKSDDLGVKHHSDKDLEARSPVKNNLPETIINSVRNQKESNVQEVLAKSAESRDKFSNSNNSDGVIDETNLLGDSLSKRKEVLVPREVQNKSSCAQDMFNTIAGMGVQRIDSSRNWKENGLLERKEKLDLIDSLGDLEKETRRISKVSNTGDLHAGQGDSPSHGLKENSESSKCQEISTCTVNKVKALDLSRESDKCSESPKFHAISVIVKQECKETRTSLNMSRLNSASLPVVEKPNKKDEKPSSKRNTTPCNTVQEVPTQCTSSSSDALCAKTLTVSGNENLSTKPTHLRKSVIKSLHRVNRDNYPSCPTPVKPEKEAEKLAKCDPQDEDSSGDSDISSTKGDDKRMGTRKKRRSNDQKFGKVSELISEEQKLLIEEHYYVDMTFVDVNRVQKSLTIFDRNSVKCNICGILYPRMDKCQVHIWGHLNMKPYRCKSCDFATVTVSNVRCHIRKSHLKIKPFECHICKKKYVTAVLLDEHLNTHTGAKPFHCKICDFASSSRQVLSYHKMTHKPDKDVICDICGKGFYSKGRMRSHMLVHTKDKAFMCKYCSAYLRDAEALERHYENVHSRDYVCNVCGKSVKSKKALNSHQSVHSAAKYKCPHCPNVYKSRHILKEHILKHDGIRKYKCDVCEKRFAQQSHLAAHMAVHSEIRFYCPGCRKAFNRHDNMKMHTKRCEAFQADPTLVELLNRRTYSKRRNLSIGSSENSSELKYTLNQEKTDGKIEKTEVEQTIKYNQSSKSSSSDRVKGTINTNFKTGKSRDKSSENLETSVGFKVLDVQVRNSLNPPNLNTTVVENVLTPDCF
ncbi:uncharacterized protein LOC105696893 isoform X2 [Orussus abietinus]|uniref:uncharacterized protein LOC105696893 isoform X2 n=1 Tax=Orussus abietinus TaxID=222816 RepID=UPI0006254802|nr:uncharacterized protein LOC105696893 isoform X2 [Orussus abietinus]